MTTFESHKGLSINDVTALGGRGYQGFCDNSTKVLLIKSVTMGGGGVENYEKLRDVIYGRPLKYPQSGVPEPSSRFLCKKGLVKQNIDARN